MVKSRRCTVCDERLKVKSPSSGQATGGDPLTDSMTKPVEFNIISRYFLNNVSPSEKTAIKRAFQDCSVPLCSFCMENVSRIYECENEIDLLRSWINIMVDCLRKRIELTCVKLASAPVKLTRINRLRRVMSRKSAPTPKEDTEVMYFGTVKTGVSLQTDPNVVASTSRAENQNASSEQPSIYSGSSPALELFSKPARQGDVPVKRKSDSHQGAKKLLKKAKQRLATRPHRSAGENPSDQKSGDQEPGQVMETSNVSAAKPKCRQKLKITTVQFTKLPTNEYVYKGFKCVKTKMGFFKCLTCDKYFHSCYWALLHIRRYHLGVDSRILKQYLCSVCGRRFREERNLRAHLASHRNSLQVSTNEGEYSCDICGKCFKLQPSLWIHRKLHNDVIIGDYCTSGNS